MHWLQALGRSAISSINGLGRATLFLVDLVACLGELRRRFAEVMAQLHNIGVLTLSIIVVAALFVGMVLGLQGYNTLVDFGAESSLGLAVALFLTRELGPVLSALLFAGRAGSALTAEIGLMKATQQLDAMEMMAVDPMRLVVVPRYVAGVVALPLLAAIFSVVGLFGGYIIGVGLLGVDSGTYWSSIKEGVDVFDDVFNGIIKSIVFGFVVTWIAVFQGYDATPTSAGVSRATTQTVVAASLAVLGLDYVLTALMFGKV